MPATNGRARARRRFAFHWRNPRLRGLVYQVLALVLIALAVGLLVQLTLANMRERGIQSGFDFLTEPTGFEIGETLIPFDSLQPYWRAFLVGLLNTVRVALLGIVLSTLVGSLLGLARFSRNGLLRGLSYGYVELVRNVPLLLQLLMWYLLMAEWLPEVGEPFELGSLLTLSKNGLVFPGVGEDGLTISPEFMAVLLGLTLYTAAFIAELVRAGIAAVPRATAARVKASSRSASKPGSRRSRSRASKAGMPPGCTW